MIDIKELDEDTIAKAEIMAEEWGMSLEDFFKVLDEAKEDFYKNKLS